MSRLTPAKVVMFVSGMALIACLIILGLWLLDSLLAKNTYDEVADTATEQTGTAATEQTIDFAALLATNPDTVAWVRIPGTAINYPVVQTTDNSTYLTRTFTGDYSLAGAIFLDAENTNDFSDVNSILYGHHRIDGTMFADLDLIYAGDLGDDVPIYLYLPDGTVRTYQVFSTYITANDPTSIATDVVSFTTFASEMLGRSVRSFSVDPLSVSVADLTSDSDEGSENSSAQVPLVLTLSTCVADDDRRYLVHAVLTSIENY